MRNKKETGMFGKKHSEETRKKMSETRSGKNNPFFGKKHSKEALKKNSEAHIGKKCLEETRKKMSESHKGKKHLEETRKKISEANKGKKNPNFGKSPSKEARKKMSEANKGKILSKETRKKISEARIGKYGLNGEKNNNWKGGITPQNKKVRNSKEYKKWKQSVFERDNFTDQKTSTSGGGLVAHHINNFAEFSELRLVTDNGITLSKKTHLDFHNKYGRRNNTKEQLLEFLNN